MPWCGDIDGRILGMMSTNNWLSAITKRTVEHYALSLMPFRNLRVGWKSIRSSNSSISQKRHATAIGEVIHQQLNWIGRSAWADYDRNRLGLRQESATEIPKKRRGRQEGQQAY